MGRTRVVVRTAVIIGALAIAFPTAARAGSITIDEGFIGVNVHYEFQGLNQPITLGSFTMSGGTGLNATLDGLAFEAYCADVLTDVLDSSAGQPEEGGTYDAEVAAMSTWQDPNGLTSPLGDANRRAAYLYDKYVVETQFAETDLQSRTALQLAIWDVLYDNDYTVATNSNGILYVSTEGLIPQTDPTHPNDQAQIDRYNAIAAAAQVFLDDVKTADVSNSDAAWLKLTVPGSGIDAQDFIGPGGTNAVPEPGSLLLLGTGIAALTAFRRKAVRG
jgi:hypothetical protein